MKTVELREFSRLVAVYLIFAALLVFLVRDDPVSLLTTMAAMVPGSALVFLEKAWVLIVGFLLLLAFARRSSLASRLPSALLVMMLCNVFFITFTVLKSSMPFVVPFYADPFFAWLDRVVHAGVDPYEIAHHISRSLPLLAQPEWAFTLYMKLWLVPAMYLPVALALFDPNPARRLRYLRLWAFSWIVLGNVLALAGFSAGPVFFDSLHDTMRFTGLHDALETAGVAAGSFGLVQNFLWESYISGVQGIGSGISAFPSVHVAMMMVLALYLVEIDRRALVPAGMLVGVFLFLSVWTGYHYALDGYVSIAAVWLFANFLRRGDAAKHLGPAG